MSESDYRYISLTEFKTNYDYGSETDANIIKKISKAEKLIDLYVGKQNKFVDVIYEGTADSGTTTTLVDDGLVNFVDGYFTYCYLIIMGGTNKGEERFITNYANKIITVDVSFTDVIDDTSIYRIEQKSKFPRNIDYVAENGAYYKYIPENIKIATALETEWIIKKGIDFIREGGDKFTSESLGSYSYTKKLPTDIEALICPEAKQYLTKYRNRQGKLVI